MTSFIVSAVVVAVISSGWKLFLWFRHTRDPDQYDLAEIIAEEAEKEISIADFDGTTAVVLYVYGKPWSKKNAAWRILNAAMIVGANRPDLSRSATALARRAIKHL